jgi:signal transduction histidine kinase
MMRRLLGESIDLTTTVGDRGLIKADPGQLHQVIVNLAVNARDAMREGGCLSLETSDVVLDEAFVHRPIDVAGFLRQADRDRHGPWDG